MGSMRIQRLTGLPVHLFLLPIWFAFVGPVLGQGPAAPVGIQKINHVVFLIKENRSFDNMFGAFNATYGTKTCTLSPGPVVPVGRAPDRYEHDIDHAWAAARLAMDGGKMDQFDLIGLGSGTRGATTNEMLTCRQFSAAQIPKD